MQGAWCNGGALTLPLNQLDSKLLLISGITIHNLGEIMDLTQNLFSLGAGAPPPVLVGRDPILENAHVLMNRSYSSIGVRT